LVERLRAAPRVVRLATGDVDDVATEAATCIVDIESSCAVLRNELIPKLMSLAPDSPDFDDALDDVAEEYRHISYHIANTRLFRHVVPK
jgi:hypothetical protein